MVFKETDQVRMGRTRHSDKLRVLRAVEGVMAVVMTCTTYYALRDVASLAQQHLNPLPGMPVLALLSAEAGGLLYLSVAFAAGNQRRYASLRVHLCTFMPISAFMQLYLARVAGVSASVLFATYFTFAYVAMRTFLSFST